MRGFFKRHYKLIFIIAVIAFAGVMFYQNSVKTKAKKSEKAIVKQGTLTEKLIISGEVDAEEKATLRFQSSGRISWVGVKEGDYVKKFQAVASLDKRDVEAALKKKLLAYMSQRWDFEQSQDDKSVRGRKRVDVPGLTDAERRVLDKAQFSLDSTVADVEIAALAKEYSLLWSPIEGIITSVGSPYAGVNATPTQAEIEVINPKTTYFSATADQTEVVKLKEGMSGELVLDSFSESTLSGIIKNISFTPKSGETGTVYTVKFSFNGDNSDYKYRLGMGGDLTFITAQKEDVLYVPVKFIKSENGRKYVKVVRNGKEIKEDVITGMETDDGTEITKGNVKEGEKVSE